MGSFIDYFDRADNVDLGTTWDPGYVAGALQIVSQQVQASGLSVPAEESYNGTIFGNDQFSQVQVVAFTDNTDSGNFAVTARMAAPTTRSYYAMVLAKASGGYTRSMEVRVAGSATSLGSDATAVNVGDVCRLTTQGTNIKAWVNGSNILSNTDSTFASGRVGLRVFDAGVLANTAVDNFIAGDFPESPNIRISKPVLQAVQRAAFF